MKDKTILEWYMKGFRDELNGSSTVESEHRVLNRAYNIGSINALVGDDVSSVDRKSDDEILKQIKNSNQANE